MKLTSRARKLLLTVHVTSSVGWMGAVAAFLALAIKGLTATQEPIAQAAYVAMSIVSWQIIVPLAMVAPASGIAQALGTPWGLLRHYWVVTKLVVTIPASAILLLHMIPTVRLAQAAAQGALTSDALHQLRVQLVADSVVALVVLGLAVVLAVYKPKGLTERGLASLRGPGALSQHTIPSWITWMRRAAFGLLITFLLLHLAGKGFGEHGSHLHFG